MEQREIQRAASRRQRAEDERKISGLLSVVRGALRIKHDT